MHINANNVPSAYSSLQEEMSYRQESVSYTAINLYTALVAQFFQTFIFHYMITLAAYALTEASVPENDLWPPRQVYRVAQLQSAQGEP